MQIARGHNVVTQGQISAMASIRKRNGRWQVQVRRRGCSGLAKSFTLRADALEWARETERSAERRGLRTDPKLLDQMTVRDLLTRYRDTVVPKKRGAQIETIIINAFLRDQIAKKKLSEIGQEHFATYRDQRLKAVKSATINRELGLIHHAFKIAQTEWGISLALNPLANIQKAPADRARERRLSGDELERLLEALKQSRNPLLAGVIRFAIATGMRRGELLNARWKDLNWQLGTLHIPLTKNGEPRTIPLSFEARRVLVELAIAWQGQDRIFPTTAEAVKQAWKRLTKRAEITDLHFHDLRHEAITRFFERGLSIPEVALISGHKDPRMLFRYTHLKAEDVAKKLNIG